MTEQLQSMLREAADDRPELALRADPWRRGRRIRLGRRVAGAAVAMTVVVAGTVLLATPDLTSTPEPAQEDFGEPALPDTLYEVPHRIPDISDDPLGEPAAVVYHGVVNTGLFSDARRPLGVGAESGEIRAVRDAGCCAGTAVLSPDGTMIGVGLRENYPEYKNEPPRVLVVDLVTGETATYALPDRGMGGGVETLVWDPGSSRVAVTADVVTRIVEDGSGEGTGLEGEWVPGWLDLTTGEWVEHGLGVVRSISGDGQHMVAEGSFRSDSTPGLVISSLDGSNAVNIGRGNYRDFVFSPDGGQFAAVVYPGGSRRQSDGYSLGIFDVDTGESIDEVELGENSSVNLLGWGERGVLVASTRVVPGAEEDEATESLIERIDLVDAGEPERSTLLVDRSDSARLGIPAAFLDADTREASPPDVGLLGWVRWIPRPIPLVILGVVVALVASIWWRRSTR